LASVERIAADDGTYEYNATTKAWALLNTTSGIALSEPDKVQFGTAAADTIDFAVQGSFGANGKYVVFGLAGDDTIRLSASYAPEGIQVTAFGGEGNDRIDAFRSQGAVVMYGDAGNDILIGGKAGDTLDGGAGNDVLADYVHEKLAVAVVENNLNGGVGTDTAVFDGKFSDLRIAATTTGFNVTSFDGKLIDHLTGIERIATDDGVYQYNTSTTSWSNISSSIGVANGLSLLNPMGIQNGTAAADTILIDSSNLNSVINGLGGDDIITVDPYYTQANPHSLVIYGGAGNDTITSKGNVYGDAGNDILVGSGRVDGGAGNDMITGDYNNGDLLTGGTGADTFVFTNFLYQQNPRIPVKNYGFGHDVITDFSIGTDHLSTTNFASASAVIQDTSSGLLITFGTASPGDILLNGVHSSTATIADLFV
jgi:Ca2+-binding RTX toxin-like protein